VISLDDAAHLALGLPEVTEGERYGTRTWLVAGKAFAWERPFSKADVPDPTASRPHVWASRVSDVTLWPPRSRWERFARGRSATGRGWE